MDISDISAKPITAQSADEPAGYDPSAIEMKWQQAWRDRGTNIVDISDAADPFYALMMFPYPSAEGLHVGNLFAFVGSDIYGRFQRLQGHNVLEPLGYDAFGIHSENYALKVGKHPSELIPRNVANFRRQLDSAGLMVDWTHSLATTDADYYKWTQWVFLQLLKHGLAYKKQAAVNWCPNDKTVLANEQVIGGACERCDTPVEQRFLSQWFFKTSQYAERLLSNLDTLDWSETTKTAQRNWIGRSEGAQIVFRVMRDGTEGSSESIRVFTTRPDTVFGATYLVLAPEHPLVASLTGGVYRAAVEQYLARSARQDVVTRKSSVDKTGVFTGSYATNPATGKEIPVWISDYVLMEYGTGAIMAVPGHDERDFEFATVFGLPIVRVVSGDGETADTPLTEAFIESAKGRIVNSGAFDGMLVGEAKQAIVRMLDEADAGSAVVNYRLHDWCISRQRYWGPPIPIIYCDDCGAVPVPEKDLPVVLPFVEDFKPDDSGVSPLARHESWYIVDCPTCGKKGRRETDVSDTFLDSAWYFLRYPSVGIDAVPFDPTITKKWLPVNSYIGGNEHAVLHLLYARFVTMVLHDMGHIDFEEPFTRFRAHGLIIRNGAKMSKSRGNVVIPDQYIEKWGADSFRTYLMFLGPFEEGGDFRDASISGVRRFLDRLWASVITACGSGAATGGEGGTATRNLATVDAEARVPASGATDAAVTRKLHQTIRKVSEDIPRLSYNTAVAAMMEYMNVLRRGERTPVRDEVEPLVRLVSPFAPHIAEELWERLGHEGSVFDAGWPVSDAGLAYEEMVSLAVQVNGKMRGKLNVPRDISQDEALAVAMKEQTIAKFVAGAPKKIVFVPGRLLSIVA